ncbi:YceI family protein [Winogradskyella echinorum]|uniref:YceI family protein n=1 Tax=Winogradskyella echinorum TaxID=538189 RepID=A0ABR6XYL6_9FLAO|nr:YceI family protein [Winogradskyella echinorum]MBC3845593.1 YceI family protein [Winogradskyella echinorum]MBC5749941.1 YceI family protein [Winogradskyella echinorum]
MKKITFLLLVLFSLSAIGQTKYLTKTGTLSFEASVPSFEEVAAKNESVTAILNTENGEFAALAFVKAFRFKNALMEEHFNENYAESDKYPKATFKGKIVSFDFDTLSETDSYSHIDGSLTFHGVTKQFNGIPLTIKVKDNNIVITGSFKVLVSDFDIEVPKIVANKLSNEVEIDFNFELVKK